MASGLFSLNIFAKRWSCRQRSKQKFRRRKQWWQKKVWKDRSCFCSRIFLLSKHRGCPDSQVVIHHHRQNVPHSQTPTFERYEDSLSNSTIQRISPVLSTYCRQPEYKWKLRVWLFTCRLKLYLWRILSSFMMVHRNLLSVPPTESSSFLAASTAFHLNRYSVGGGFKLCFISPRKSLHGFQTEHVHDGSSRVSTHAPHEQCRAHYDRWHEAEENMNADRHFIHKPAKLSFSDVPGDTVRPIWRSLCSLCSPGHHAQMNQQHMIPTRNFQMHRMPADDIQDDFDWDSIV